MLFKSAANESFVLPKFTVACPVVASQPELLQERALGFVREVSSVGVTDNAQRVVAQV